MTVGFAGDFVSMAGMPPGCNGARRPEKRVTARSNPPRKDARADLAEIGVRKLWNTDVTLCMPEETPTASAS